MVDVVVKNLQPLTKTKKVFAEAKTLIKNYQIKEEENSVIVTRVTEETANFLLIYKNGYSKAPNNFRPIFLTSIPCKTIEHKSVTRWFQKRTVLPNSIKCILSAYNPCHSYQLQKSF